MTESITIDEGIALQMNEKIRHVLGEERSGETVKKSYEMQKQERTYYSPLPYIKRNIPNPKNRRKGMAAQAKHICCYEV